MADEIRIPVSADTTPMERNIADATRRVGTVRLNANIDSRGLESLSRPLGKITGQADEFSKSMEAANARVLAFGASVGVINAISNAFKGLVSSTIEVEKSLTEIKIIGNETFKDLSATSAGLFSTAKQLGVSYKDAADATLEFARQGKGLTESLNASKAALALTRTAGISATEAVMGLTSAVNAFGRGADAYIEYANKMSAVSDSFAVNNKDLIEGMSRSASVAQEAGVSFEELTALITTLQEKTGRGGAVIGNALKTIFTRVQNPEIIKDLRDLGIAVQDTSTGSFLTATQIIQNLANEFEGFDKNLRNSVLLKVGGGFQVDKLAALLKDVKDADGTFKNSFNIAMSGSGNILGRVAELNKTIDSSFTNLVTSSKQLGSNIGQIAFSKDFANILQNGASLIGSLNEAIFGNGGKEAEDQGSTIGKALLKGIGSVVSGPGLALFVGILGKLSLDFAKFSTTGIQTLLGITSKTKEEQLIQAAISKTLSENTEFQKRIFNLEGNRVAQAELLLSVIRQQVSESKKLQDITKGASSILYDRGVRVSGPSPTVIGSAKGYIPNLSSAISKEKSESPAGSKIIVDSNFPMGGGERGTMVYNSNETRIKNFAGSGGDAIIPNYPINSASGYTPNFAEKKPRKPPTDPNNILTIDAQKASIAGLTFGGETQGIMEKAKSIPLDEKLLNKYQGSPFLTELKQFERFNIVNLPVGSVYKFRKGLKGDEDTIKKDFVARLNSEFRNKFIEVISNEITGLGLENGGGVGENLKNLKLNIFTPSSAGYIFEEILKIPTLTNAEKVAQYAAQSETEFFDMQNLEPNFAKEYGLPAKKHRYVELKLGEGELYDGISKKFLNQIILEGGGADPGKFGVRSKRAASGYIPNFNQKPKTGFVKDDAVEQGNNLEKNLYDLIGIGMEERPVGGATLDIPKGVLDKFPKGTLEKLGIQTGKPFKTEYGDIKLSNNKDSITSLISKFLRNRGDSIDKSLSYSSKGFSMLYKNGPADARVQSKRQLSELVKENVSLFDLIPWSLKNTEGEKNKKNTKGLQLNEEAKKLSVTLAYNADRLIQDSEKLPSDKILFPEKYNIQNASKSYIPNFAYELGINKDNVAIRSVTSPFDEKGNRIRGSGAVREAILAAIEKAKLKGFTKISADIISDASLNAFTKQFGRAVKGKNTWEISEFKNASKGYVPNFSKDAIGKAFAREKIQSGLPNSQISLTQDSRLANNLNPSGFAVINKRDEPNGKVPSGRISDAYKNAFNGFVPNFAGGEPPNAAETFGRRVVQQGRGLTEGTTQAIAARNAQDATQQRVVEEVITEQKNYVEILKRLYASLNLGKTKQDNFNQRVDELAGSLKDLDSKTEDQIKKLSIDISSGAKGAVKANKVRELFNQAIAEPAPTRTVTTSVSGSADSETVNTSEITEAIAQAIREGIEQAASSDKSKKENKENKEKEKSETKEKKSITEIATRLFVFQSALSFASGAISSFGGQFEKIGEALNDAGQSLIAFTQTADLSSQIRGEKKEGENGLFAGGGKLRNAGALLVGAAGVAYGAIQAIGALDKGLMTLNGTFTNSKNFIDDLDISLSKYNIQLSDQSRKIGENLSKVGSVSGAGIGGFFNANGLNISSILASFGLGNEKQAKIKENLGSTGFSEEANQDISKRLGQLVAPQIASKFANENNGAQIGTAQLQKLTEESLAKTLESFRNESLKAVTVLDPETEKRIKTRRQVIASEEAKAKNVDRKGRLKGDEPDYNRIAKINAEINQLISDRTKSEVDEATYQKKIKEFLEGQVTEAQNAAVEEERRKEALLFSSELLKAQLTSYQQISKIQSSIPSMAENQLSIEKELLTTTEARRMEIDRQSKSLSEQRQLTSDIKDSALTLGRERIDKYLSQVSGSLDVRGDTADRIREAFKNLAAARTPEEAEGLFGGVLQSIQLRPGATDKAAIDANKNVTALLNEQLSVVKANFAARTLQNAAESQNLAIIKLQNQEINFKKELLNSELSSIQKRIEFQKQELDLTRQTKDLRFETSQIGKSSRQASISLARKNLQDAIERPAEDLKIQTAQYDISRKQSIANFLGQKNARPEQIAEVLKQNPEEQIKSIQTIINTESDSFADQVRKSGDYFYEAMVRSSALISDKLNQTQTTSEKYSGIEVGSLSKSSLEKIRNEAITNSAEENDDLIKKIEARLASFDEKPKGPQASLEQTKTLAESFLPPEIAVKKIQERNKAAAEKQAALLEEELSKSTFKTGFRDAGNELKDEIDVFQYKLGKDVPMAFRDSMVSAMRELANPNSTQPLKERLLGVASAFLQKINEAFMTQAANKLTSNIMGVIPGMASGGYIKGGSGSKDDVPAMLMGGEYVVKKNAVQKYGPSFFDALNKGSIKKFANGGWVESDVTKYQDPSTITPYGQKRDQGLSFNENGQVIGMDSYTGIPENKQNAMMRAQSDYYARNAQTGQGGFYMPGENGMGAIMGQRNLLAFATQQTAGTQFDRISGAGNAASVDLGAGSSNMSLFALRDQENSRNASYLESKQKSLDLYFGGIDAAKEKANREEEIRKEQERIKKEYEEQKKKARKQMIQGIVASLATSAVIAGVGYLGNTMSQGMNAAKQAAWQTGEKTSFMQGALSGATMNGQNKGGLLNSFNSRGTQDFSNMVDSGGNFYQWDSASKNYSWQGADAYNKAFPTGGNYGSSPNSNGYYFPTKNYSTKGISNSLMNRGNPPFYDRKAAGGYVAGNGMGDNVPAMLNGGEFVISKQAAQNVGMNKLQQLNSGAATSESSDIIVAKLDELVEKLNAVGTLNITVNSNGGNERQSQEGGSESDDKQRKELARKIKEVVLGVLREEKRLGGLLR